MPFVLSAQHREDTVKIYSLKSLYSFRWLQQNPPRAYTLIFSLSVRKHPAAIITSRYNVAVLFNAARQLRSRVSWPPVDVITVVTAEKLNWISSRCPKRRKLCSRSCLGKEQTYTISISIYHNISIFHNPIDISHFYCIGVDLHHIDINITYHIDIS